MKRIKESATKATLSTKRVVNNAEQFVQACSLLTVAVFSYWATRQLDLNDVVLSVVTAALAVIGLRGAYEFIKFLDKE